ncbi:Zona pellucida domain containing protein [Trichuris trichiura]|uniref:Zona pellucida domain containing protein n=1 Tax=Trichuris trichiura TaxID=36087 RepID=A0A077ZJ68_TRITR|nr:Zona pellucida domain containing protein [Trichuris trichiura]
MQIKRVTEANIGSCSVSFARFVAINATAYVGIQCSVNGITAKFQFYNPFNGRIYSANFQHDRSCMYYDKYGEQRMLFEVPSFRCGTRSWRNSENRIVHLENEIYVQLDKYSKSRDDKRYIFVCKEKPPERHEQSLQWKMKQDIVHNFQGEQTVLVQLVSNTGISNEEATESRLW